jgi:type VI secretion system secreted protein VgrG
VTTFTSGSLATRGLRLYEATIASWTWFLTRTRNFRIFQEKSATEIAEAIFKELGFTDYELKDGAKSAPAREYCVQFGETAYDFIARLFEEEGIFWFVRHDDTKDVLVIGGAAGAFPTCARDTVLYSDGTVREPHIVHWREEVRFDSGKWASTDYNFEKPEDLGKKLSSTEEKVQSDFLAKTADSYEIFDYPGRFVDPSRGGKLAKLRAEAIEARLSVIDGISNCPELAAGVKFKLSGFECDSTRNGKEFIVRTVNHKAQETGYVQTKDAVNEYINAFEVMPAQSTYRPPLVTPWPRVDGVQSATVVGPSGEEIYTEKYGRVKVQFHWDREGKKDEKSSCWVRVAQGWAGEKWGAVCLPRIGQEVLIEFVNGDPDRPIVVGRVYNADQMPPYELPSNKTQSGLKTRSSAEGDAKTFNELRFEDKKDSEQIYFHAEKDFDRVVENNDTLKVGFDKKDPGDQTIEVYNNRTETVKEGNETVTIEKGDRTVKIGEGNESLEVTQGDRTVTVKQGKDEHTVETGDRTVTVKTGNDSHAIDTGNRDVKIKTGNDTLNVDTGNLTIKVALGKITIEAMQSIELKVGQNTMKFDQTGITVKGMMVNVEGSATTEIKSPMTTVKGDGMLTVKGGITMIN